MISTKRFLALTAALAWLHVPTANAAESSTTIARFHFLGAGALAGNTNAAKLQQIAKLPETAQLRTKVLDKIAAAPATAYLPTANDDRAAKVSALIRPLLDDLLEHESIFEVNEVNNRQLALHSAVRLDPKRAEFWSSNLTALGVLWTSHEAAVKSKNWSTQLSPGITLRFTQKDEWTIVTVGPATESEQFVSSISKNRLALQKGNWLEAHLDWPHLEKHFGISIPFKFTESDITITGKANDLFTTVRSALSQKPDVKREPWHIPTVVRDPIVSFTAAQPLESLCKQSQLFEQIGFNPLAHQFFCWAEQGLPFQTFCALRIDNATNQFNALASKLPANVNATLKQRSSGELVWDSNRHELFWTNAPMVVPYLRPYSDDAGQFIAGGLFPRAPLKTPPPTELLKQVTDNSKLLYYDWEVTENRIGHWDMITRALPVFSPETLPSNGKIRMTRNSRLPAHMWIRATARFLGNTATEATLTGPKEITIKRRSNVGFTGMELIFFAGLIDEPNFPFIVKR